MFIRVPISDMKDEKKELEDVRINMRYVTDYRPWLNEDESKPPQTVFFFADKKKQKIIGDIDCRDVDKQTINE